MTCLSSWLRWLFTAHRENAIERIAALEGRADRAEKQVAELKGALTDTIGELNQIRNAIPPIAATPDSTSRIRRMGSWRATVAAIEGRPIPHSPQPIPLERTA